jgi:ribosomal-protein-alanine N-acetyltransferase
MLDEPHLLTPRLHLRIPGPEDARLLAAYVRENREHLAPWDPHHPEAYFTVGYWRDQLASMLNETRAGRLLPFVLLPRDDEAPLRGRCTFSNIVRGPFQACYLGYSLDRTAVGHGYMEEALREAIRYVFEDVGLHRIMANYVPENERSAHLLDKLGFEREGYAHDYLRIEGQWRDHVLSALSNPSWQARD